MTNQIIDRRTVGIPGATGSVTPELLAARDEAVEAAARTVSAGRDADRAESAADRAESVADSVDMDAINQRIDGIQGKADGAVQRPAGASDCSVLVYDQRTGGYAAAKLGPGIAVEDGTIRAKRADLVDSIRYPLYIAHRGSPLCYPEHSWEGYRASFEAGFTPEADVVALADGTLVCLHDSTTNRTMDIQKPVNRVTPEEWRRSRIKPPSHSDRILGTGEGTPVFFEDYLDEFGGKIVLWPEIKDASAAPQFIRAVTDRGLHRSIVLQSNSLAVVRQIRAAGVAALMLGTAATPAQLQAEGVEFVGLSRNVAQSFINDCKNRGIRVIGYTFNTKADADAQFARGCDGIFTDDPWETSREFVPPKSLNLDTGMIPPALGHMRSHPNDTPANTTSVVEIANGALLFRQAVDAQSGANNLKLGTFGIRGPAVRVRFWAQAVGVGTTSVNTEGRWLFGLYLGKQNGEVAVNEDVDSSWRLAMVRRDGRKHAYEKRASGGNTNLLETVNAPSVPYAKPGSRGEPMQFEVEFSATQIIIRNLTRNDTDLEASHSAWSAQDLYLTLSVSGAVGRVWGIHLA